MAKSKSAPMPTSLLDLVGGPKVQANTGGAWFTCRVKHVDLAVGTVTLNTKEGWHIVALDRLSLKQR